MALLIYKPGQGYWTRTMSFIGALTLIATGAAWAWTQLENVSRYTVYIQAGTAAVILLGLGGLLFWLINLPRIVEFMIATEAEMNKVAWPSRRQLVLLTWVVVVGTFLMATLLFVVDLLFGTLFQWMHILQTAS